MSLSQLFETFIAFLMFDWTSRAKKHDGYFSALRGGLDSGVYYSLHGFWVSSRFV